MPIWANVTNNPVRNKLLQHLETVALARINGISPYVYNVADRISRDMTNEDLQGALPCVEFAITDEQPEALSSSTFKHPIMSVAVLMTIPADYSSSAPSLSEQGMHALADLERAMVSGSNGEHNGIASFTRLATYRLEPVQGEPIIDVYAEFEIHFTYDYSDPHNAAGL